MSKIQISQMFLSLAECNRVLEGFDAKAKELKRAQEALSVKKQRCNGQLNTSREEEDVRLLSEEMDRLSNVEVSIVRSALEMTRGRFKAGRLNEIGHYGDYLTMADHHGEEFYAFIGVNSNGDEYTEVTERDGNVTYYEDPNPAPKPPVDTRW